VPANSLRRLLNVSLLCLLIGTAIAAGANSVTVTGNAYSGATSDGLSLTAGNLSAFSAAPDGPSIVGFGMVGVPMSLSWFSFAFPGPDNTAVNIGSNSTDLLTGQINFSGTFTIPPSALFTGTFTTPVSVSGQLQAFQDLGGMTQGPLMANLLFSGTGMATFQLENVGEGTFVIVFANVTFNDSGTQTVVPEPASLFLVGTGLAGLAAAAKRKRSSSKS
jgi:hypothetical protein